MADGNGRSGSCGKQLPVRRGFEGKRSALCPSCFSEGRHGLSLANEKWANGEYGEPYTMEQTLKIAENVKNGNIQVSEEVKESFLPQFERSEEETKALLAENSPNDEVAVWPVLAHQWIKAVLKPE